MQLTDAKLITPAPKHLKKETTVLKRNPQKGVTLQLDRPQLRLRALQPQQLKYTLLKLELPRLLAPDFPFN